MDHDMTNTNGSISDNNNTVKGRTIPESNRTNTQDSVQPQQLAVVPFQPQTSTPPTDNEKPIGPSVTLTPRPDEEFVYLTEELLNLPQSETARRIGVPTSSLSKKWKEVAGERKWPFRTVSKLDKEIASLIEANTIPENGPRPLPPDIEQALGLLIRRRTQELRTVLIRLRKKEDLIQNKTVASNS